MHVARIILLGLVGLLAGCSLIPGASLGPREERLQDLAEHQAAWIAKGVDDYSFSVERSCFCPPDGPYDVTVVNGVVTNVTRAGKPVRPDEARLVPKTVPELFAIVAAQVDAAKLTVGWDPAFGFPASISADPVANMADEEFGIVVTNFRPAS